MRCRRPLSHGPARLALWWSHPLRCPPRRRPRRGRLSSPARVPSSLFSSRSPYTEPPLMLIGRRRSTPLSPRSLLSMSPRCVDRGHPCHGPPPCLGPAVTHRGPIHHMNLSRGSNKLIISKYAHATPRRVSPRLDSSRRTTLHHTPHYSIPHTPHHRDAHHITTPHLYLDVTPRLTAPLCGRL